MQGTSRIAALLACFAAASVAAAGPAHADTVVRKAGTHVVVESGSEENDVSMTEFPAGPVIADHKAPIFAGAGCVKTGSITVVCNGSYDLVEIRTGGRSDDIRVANSGAFVSAVLDGGPAGDTIVGGAEPDVIRGGSEVDTLDGGGGNDDIGPGLGIGDVVIGGPGSDFVFYGERSAAVRVTLDGMHDDGVAGENDVLSGIEGAFGGSAGDILLGNSGSGRFFGGLGDDLIRGGTGNDTISGGPGVDTASYAERSAGVVARIDDWMPSGAEGERDHILEDVEGLIGGSGNDTLSGHEDVPVADELDGRAGSDDLIGWTGPDHLLGGTGNDRLYGIDGDDMLEGEDGDDKLWGYAGGDTLVGGLGNDLLQGMGDNDTLLALDGTGFMDTGSCGTEWDHVARNKTDSIADCEVLLF